MFVVHLHVQSGRHAHYFAELPVFGEQSGSSGINFHILGFTEDALVDDALSKRWALLGGLLNEAQRRRWAGLEAHALGADGVRIVARTTGLARQTVQKGLDELLSHEADGSLGPWFLDPALDQREAGGGRRRRSPELAATLETLMERQKPGENWRSEVFTWTCLSLRQLAEATEGLSSRVSRTTVSALLDGLGFQVVNEPWAPKRQDFNTRIRQYMVIADAVTSALDAAQPVVVLRLSKIRRATDWISHDEKDVATRLIRADRALRLTLQGSEDMDEVDQGKRGPWRGGAEDAPDVHTVALAVETVRQWWERHGHKQHQKSGEALVVTNALGFEGDALERWTGELARFAVDAGIGIRACYLPPGICRWSHCAQQLGTVLGIKDPEASTARHEVVCRAIDWTSLPEHASDVLGQQRREARRRPKPRRRPPLPSSMRFQRQDAPEPERYWDFSICCA